MSTQLIIVLLLIVGVPIIIIALNCFFWLHTHNKRINQLTERLDELNILLMPLIAREAKARCDSLSSGIDGLAEMIEDIGKDNPWVKDVLAPQVENLRGAAQKIKGSEK